MSTGPSEESQFVRWSLITLAIIVIGIVVIVLVSSALYPKQIEAERQAEQQSSSFVQTMTSQLQTDYAAYFNNQSKNASTAQQQALINKMHNEYNLLPADARDNLPSDLRQFLSDNRATQ